ncbi:MAG: hypothetical protein AAFP69_16995 [Planctomycetota bacterium]
MLGGLEAGAAWAGESCAGGAIVAAVCAVVPFGPTAAVGVEAEGGAVVGVAMVGGGWTTTATGGEGEFVVESVAVGGDSAAAAVEF